MIFYALLACAPTIAPNDTADDGGNPGDSGSEPDCSGADAPQIVINEFLASNKTTNTDNADEYDDWVELYNAGDRIVQMTGFYLTDDPPEPQQWAFPEGVGIAAGDFLIVWCDADDDEQGTSSELHTNFLLDRKADDLQLWYYEDPETCVRKDAVKWTQEQVKDKSAQRMPDGNEESGAWVLATPTPEEPNQDD